MMAGVGMNAPVPASAPAHSSSSSSDTIDPVTKFKMLVPPLKEALQKVMNNAAALFSTSAQFDSNTTKQQGSQQNLQPQQRFDRSLEEFYALCDQIEMNLSLTIEIARMNADGQRYTPIPAVQSQLSKYASVNQGVQPPSDQQTYAQYQATVKAQISSAREVHDLLVDCAKRIEQLSQPPAS